LRFGLAHEAPMTLEAIGRLFKVTRERIRQIEASAVKKMHKHMQKAKRKLDLNRLMGLCDAEAPVLAVPLDLGKKGGRQKAAK